MKKGDIVVCIQYPGLYDSSHGSVYWDNAVVIFFKSASSNFGISQGTKYEVMGSCIAKSGKLITITNDHGIISDYKADKFKPLSEWREMRLKELGV